MRGLAWVLFALLTVGTAGAASAGDADLMREIEVTRAITDAERKALVADAMDLTDDESQVFWGLYRDYRADVAGIGDRMVELIAGFAERYANVTDAEAAEMLDEWLDIENQLQKVRRQHVKKFRKELPDSTTLRFFQLDNKLDQLIRIQLAAEIPLAR